MTHRRKFIGLIAGASCIGLAGCSEPNEENIEYITSNTDNTLSPNEWEETNNYEEQSTDNGSVIVDNLKENNRLIIYTSGTAPQSNYKLEIEDVYVDDTLDNNPLIIDGVVTPTDSDVGLTVITDVETIIEVSTDKEFSKIIFNIEDGWYDSYSIQTNID